MQDTVKKESWFARKVREYKAWRERTRIKIDHWSRKKPFRRKCSCAENEKRALSASERSSFSSFSAIPSQQFDKNFQSRAMNTGFQIPP